MKPSGIKDVFVVLEMLDSDLRTVVKNHMELKRKQVKTIMYHLCQGVYYMHMRGIMHRDLKPNNVLLNEDCVAKLCDFGLSRAVGTQIYSNTQVFENQDQAFSSGKKMNDDL